MEPDFQGPAFLLCKITQEPTQLMNDNQAIQLLILLTLRL
jgi:hypothetical protein